MKVLMVAVALAALVVAGGFAAWGFLDREVVEGECSTTVPPGGDVSRAVFDAAAGATVCLAAGTHQPFVINRARPGLTVRGVSADATVVQARERNAIDLLDSERVTLAGLSVRGGSPAAVYAGRVRGLTLRDVRIESAETALHLDEGVPAIVTNVDTRGSTAFGVLVRRGASLTARTLRVSAAGGIGVAAVDAPGSVILTDGSVAHEPNARGENLVLNGFERFSLTGVTIRGGQPAGIYVAKARELRMRDVEIQGANFGLHLDENAIANLDDVRIVESTGVGLLLQRGGTVTGTGVRVLDTSGTGVSAINGPGLLTLRDSEISRVAAAGLFAGVAGCADLPPASLEVPACFYDDMENRISTARVVLERVRMEDTTGPCLVFFPGARAEVRGSTFVRCELTGLFAWGARADVSTTTFEDNAEHALEYRAFPDPRAGILREAFGAIEDVIVRGTRPLEGAILGDLGPGPVLGGGILAQAARLEIRRTEVTSNRDIGVSFVNGSSGALDGVRITNNGGAGLCIVAGSTVTVTDTTIAGNRTDSPSACGGRPAT
jgi:hypothetical protein